MYKVKAIMNFDDLLEHKFVSSEFNVLYKKRRWMRDYSYIGIVSLFIW